MDLTAWAEEYIGIDAVPEISYCVVKNNLAGDYGGGIFCIFSGPVIRNCRIYNNEVTQGNFGFGGGIYCTGYMGPTISNCLVYNNNANDGGGVHINCSSLAVVNINSCTIVNNTSNEAGGISVSASANIAVNSCILYENNPQQILLYGQDLPSNVFVFYSDIEGGEEAVENRNESEFNWVEGSINEDPLFVDPENDDYQLFEGSPCIDTGDPDFPFDPDSTRADMGALYFHQEREYNNPVHQPFDYRFGIEAYPNPFNSSSTIEYALPFTSDITLSLYNLSGQRVETLINGRMHAGVHRVMLDAGDMASGLYFVKLEGVGQAFTQKIMLVK